MGAGAGLPVVWAAGDAGPGPGRGHQKQGGGEDTRKMGRNNCLVDEGRGEAS